MQQLLSGVEYMHRHWVIHRDLKTSNLLLDNRGILKVCRHRVELCTLHVIYSSRCEECVQGDAE